MTGLSGNEMYCLSLKQFSPGNLVIGNSVHSLGFVGSLVSGFKTIAGGEIHEVTSLIHDGRHAAYERMLAWSDLHSAAGITGVSSELVKHGTNIEFLSIGSAIHDNSGKQNTNIFSTSADGQELYCQLDCGFHPHKFVFGNVAYSIGISGGIVGAFRGLARGEVKEYSEVFNITRHLALSRLKEEAVKVGANAVVGVKTTILPIAGMQEMLMIGTASRHEALGNFHDQNPVTSDLTNEELWNIIKLGYMPLDLVLGVSVYSVGFVGGVSAFFKSFARGEINELTTLIYDARENALGRIMQDAVAVGADDVLGIKTYVYELGGGIIEFLAIGTAVKKIPGLSTVSDNLPAQAVIRDKDTFFNMAETSIGQDLGVGSKSK